ncbi:Hint domain-containing protein [Paracoccus albus]|uniref:Hint domain-containing protein n=1 Tax=Paracoccus albus TaxID=3017784 RepID=UPI0022F03D3C|nr:Hint domain-containing protein [Paracoccus albus]WBU62182.1 Hint domain-containing protein [Paracoccus albus]
MATNYGTSSNNNIGGTANNDYYDGAEGDDSLTGAGGNDSLSGSEGNDTLRGGDGYDALVGGAGSDTIAGDAGNDVISGDNYIAVNASATGNHGQLMPQFGSASPYSTTGVSLTVGHDTLGTVDVYYIEPDGSLVLMKTVQPGNPVGITVPANSQLALVQGGVIRGVMPVSSADAGTSKDLTANYDANFGENAPGGAADSILGGAGNDTIFGDTGDDTIDGGGDNDRIFGGSGDDSVNGGLGDDAAQGGLGNDTLIGDDGTASAVASNDALSGGAGRDSISGGIGQDALSGGDDDDTIDGGSGNDTISGGGAMDSITGGAGNDVIRGDGLDALPLRNSSQQVVEDILTSEAGSASEYGGGPGPNQHPGEVRVTFTNNSGVAQTVYYIEPDGTLVTDTMGVPPGTVGNVRDFYFPPGANIVMVNNATGEITQLHENVTDTGSVTITTEGNDLAQQYAPPGGADTIDGGTGNDLIKGLEGDDSIQGGDGLDTIEGGVGSDKLLGGAQNDLVYGGVGDDSILGDVGDDTLYGGADDDTIRGGDGEDDIFGDDGNDVLHGGGSDDLIKGGAGDDTIYGGDESLVGDSVDGGEGNDVVYGGDGQDYVSGGDTGDDTLYGGAGNDNIDGFAGKDYIDGGTGNDTIWSGTDDDTILGGTGEDKIKGEAGRDYIDGGEGDDSLVGGEGFDTFVAGDGDTIADFNTAANSDIDDNDQTNNDYVDLSGYYNDANLAVYNARAEALGQDTYSNPLAWLRGDQNDDGILNDVTKTGIDNGQGTGETIKLTMQITGATGDELTYDNTNVMCFCRGTLIETADGPVPIEDLVTGDLVLTKDNGLKPILWIGSNSLSAEKLGHKENLRPIRIAANALAPGYPAQDLHVSPQHRILLRSRIAQKMFGEDEILVAAKQLLSVDGIDFAEVDEVEYFHFLFDQHELVFANGTETESLYTGPEALKAVSEDARAEILTLFPELRNKDYTAPATRQMPSGRMSRKLVFRHLKNGKPLFTSGQV